MLDSSYSQRATSRKKMMSGKYMVAAATVADASATIAA